MFDHKVRLLTEGFARAMGRRKFLTQMGAAVFASVATLASSRALGGTVLAQQKGDEGLSPPLDPFGSLCQAPNNRFCTITESTTNSDGCQGAYCFQHLYNSQLLECKLSYNYGYAVGCWTTFDYSNNGYWTCCDCDCGSPIILSAACGCARFSTILTPSSS
jgi:hypothetical protein